MGDGVSGARVPSSKRSVSRGKHFAKVADECRRKPQTAVISQLVVLSLSAERQELISNRPSVSGFGQNEVIDSKWQRQQDT